MSHSAHATEVNDDISPAPARWAEQISNNESLDALASYLRPVANALTKNDRVRGILRGNFMGHALHPLLTDLPMGFWSSALTLDLVAPKRGQHASECLTGLGVLAAAPTAATGLAEWSDVGKKDARIGAVHAVSNTAALAMFAVSYFARRGGRVGWGRTFGLLGAVALSVGGHLGGHLAIARKVGSHAPVASD